MVNNKKGVKKAGGKEADPGKLISNKGDHFGKLKGSGCLASLNRARPGEPLRSGVDELRSYVETRPVPFRDRTPPQDRREKGQRI